MYESLGLRAVTSHIQSGNVLFKTDKRNLAALAARIEETIEKRFGFRPTVVLRTAEELREVIRANPFADRRDVEPNRLAVVFLAAQPGAEAREKAAKLDAGPEEMRIAPRELYIHYVNGMGRPKLAPALLEKTLKVEGTARNWNTVTKLGEMADNIETAH